ncbi:MAG: hypothetical protein EAZ30_01185 [Betaproteobacteria bacterium]|nr:MAG: hypothetical protein EAZ30_01185 [Betaproteobacteria bacterium]
MSVVAVLLGAALFCAVSVTLAGARLIHQPPIPSNTSAPAMAANSGVRFAGGFSGLVRVESVAF